MADLVGISPAFQRLMNAARMVAGTGVGVLLIGEAGSGKAMMARAIHDMSPRAGGAFETFACAGAPPGALGDRVEALAGKSATLYLDEVDELAADDQARLLHFIADQDNLEAGHRLRLIVASAVDLGAAVERGAFRRDLYLRLCVVPLEVPPLRDRVSDIPALTAHFLTRATARHRLASPRLSASLERQLRHYPWPGNLRELANLCERLVLLYPGRDVTPEDLPQEILRGGVSKGAAKGFELPPQGIDLNGLEAELIRQALALAGGNKSRAARLLGLTRDTLLYRIQKHLIPA